LLVIYIILYYNIIFFISKIIRPIICFVIQRTDSSSFQASLLDLTYKEAFNEALKKGVEVIVLVVSWNANGEANFVKCDLPVNL
jgi:DNA-binding sugar fermentation-stimulating protein